MSDTMSTDHVATDEDFRHAYRTSIVPGILAALIPLAEARAQPVDVTVRKAMQYAAALCLAIEESAPRKGGSKS